MLATGGVFLREYLDGRIRSRDEAAHAVGAPVLAAVPRPPSGLLNRVFKLDRLLDRLLKRSRPIERPNEPYRALRVNLTRLGLGKSVRRLLITSPVPDEGKGDTVAGLARTCANAGLRTLVISADPRRTTPLPLPEGAAEIGLLSILKREATLQSAIILTDPPGLCVVTLGPNPSDDLDLLSVPQFGELLAEASELVEVVLIDAPAISDGADTTAIAAYTDASLMVIKSHSSKSVATSRAAIALGRAGSSPIGILLHNGDPRDQTQGVFAQMQPVPPPPSSNGSGNGRVPALLTEHRLIDLDDTHDSHLPPME